MAKRRVDPLSVAQSRFGFREFRPGQAESIGALVAGRDALVVMPTGSGKSAIYQVAGLVMEGAVLVVSPLIALQKDQVDSINGDDGQSAVVINSGLKASELRAGLERIASGCCRFIFLAPEQLQRSEAVEALERARVRLIAVDEAHCISAWGHDFRPDYLHLGHVIQTLGHPPTVAMTATASARVRAEIMERLGLHEPFVYVGGFDRPNLYLEVRHFGDRDEKLAALLDAVQAAEKPGLVYVATRKSAEKIVDGLESRGVAALFYHGGLNSAERSRIQDVFMSDGAEVIVATNAFGMGIDKPNVRFVYHYDAPESLDSYYQEVGRAGRDGGRAEAVLFFCEGDIEVLQSHGAEKTDMRELTHLAGTIEAAEEPISPQEIAEQARVSARKVTAAIQKLEDAEVVEVLPSGEVQLEDGINWDAASELIAERDEIHKQANRERLEQMLRYAEWSGCRREELLRYFGDEFYGPCFCCDQCWKENAGVKSA